jgi:hypothetical protein
VPWLSNQCSSRYCNCSLLDYSFFFLSSEINIHHPAHMAPMATENDVEVGESLPPMTEHVSQPVAVRGIPTH